MTRQQGVVASAAGLVPFGHLGWGYRDRAEFYDRAAEYIADGLAENQWVEYVGAGSRAELAAEVAALPGIPADHDIRVTPAPEFYAVPDGTDVVDPQIAVATRCTAVEKALADGYTGFRAVVDATAVTRTPEQRDAFACFEFLIDQKMAELPVSALCAYDLGQLAGDAPGLICLHPLVGQRAPTFRLYAEPGSSFAVTGEIDAACGEMFAATLRRVGPLVDTGPWVIDAAGLDFISHPQLLELDRLAAASGRRVVLRTRNRIPSRLAELLQLSNVAVQPPD